MKQTWDDYEKATERGPVAIVAKVSIAMLAFGICVSVVAYGLGWFSEGAAVAQEQFGARALLSKYEWFKDAAAQAEKKKADVGVYEARIAALVGGYGETPRAKWAREDREQLNVWQSEVAGVKASYNQLAAEYNAAMVKFNYRFANVGDLPQGATEPLPRAFKEYEVK